MSKDNKKKKKKPKVKYIDDGRSLADMSALNGGKRRSQGSAKGTLKDQAKTFFGAMKMMFKPMLAVMAVITLAFFIMWLLLMLSLI